MTPKSLSFRRAINHRNIIACISLCSLKDGHLKLLGPNEFILLERYSSHILIPLCHLHDLIKAGCPQIVEFLLYFY